MIRGFLSGAIWGGLFSVVILGVLSQLSGMIDLLTTPPEAVASLSPDPATGDITQEVLEPAVEPAPPQGQLANAAAPLAIEPAAAEEAAPAAGAPQAESAAPQASAAAPVAIEPVAAGVQAPATSSQTDAPVTAAAPAAAEPGALPETAAETAPVAVPPLQVAQAEVETEIAAGEAPQAGAIAPAGLPQALPEAQALALAPAGSTLPDAAQAETAPAVSTAPPSPAVLPEPVAEPATEPAAEPAQPDAPAVAGDATEATSEPPVAPPADLADISPEAEMAPEAAPDEAGAAGADTAELPAVITIEPGASQIRSAGGFANLAPNVRINRLPAVGDEADATAETATAVTGETAQAAPEAGGALDRFAQPFENAEGRPLMAVILIDEGAGPGAEPLPFPVSYAVDPQRADAGALMRSFRASGAEILALASLPEGATPQDAEVAIAGYLRALPESVAVLDSETATVNSGRLLASQVVEALAAQGMGLVTYERGLNAALQVAARDVLPAGLVFRDLDGRGQDRATIQRFLDQAAFRAGQGAPVILVAHNRPETLAALAEWMLGTRAATVRMAPVSAVLAPAG